MKISVSVAYCTQEALDSANQAVNSFNGTLGSLASARPPFQSITELAFSLELTHPLARKNLLGISRYYRARTQTFFVGAPLDYLTWATGHWDDRIDAIAAGLVAGVAAVFKTRISPAERALVLDLILRSCDYEKAHPPETVLHPGAVYLAGSSVSFAEPPVDIPDMIELVVVERQELAGFMARKVLPHQNRE